MHSAALRILDANLNRAREGLRVLEEYARFVLNDAKSSALIKNARHALVGAANQLDVASLLSNRDTPGDVGTAIATASESSRAGTESVARAASARVGEALRCIEEYGKLVSLDVARRIEQLRYAHYSIEQQLFAVAPRRSRFREAKLHVLLTESLCRLPWLETAERVLDAGADVIQLREKSLSDSDLLERAGRLRELTKRFDAMLVINDRPDIARLVGADAVHLGQEDLPVAAAREIAGPTTLVGGSAHDQAEIERMLAADVDYLGVGPMFDSGTKPDVSVRGPELLALAIHLVGQEAASAESPAVNSNESAPAPTPLVAIGGITASNIALLRRFPDAKFAVAVCGGIIGQPDPAAATRQLLSALDTPQASHAGRS